MVLRQNLARARVAARNLKAKTVHWASPTGETRTLVLPGTFISSSSCCFSVSKRTIINVSTRRDCFVAASSQDVSN